MARNRKHRTATQQGIFGIGWDTAATQRLLLLLVTTGFMFVALWARLLPQAVSWQVGQRADRTIRARRSAVYEDSEATQNLRDKAVEDVPDQYHTDPTARDDAMRAVGDIFSQARQVRADEALPQALDKLEALKGRLDIELSDETLRLLIEAPDGSLERMEESAETVTRVTMGKSIRDNTNDLQLEREEVARRVEQLAIRGKYAGAVTEIASKVLKPNQIFDQEETEKKQREAADAVAKVWGQIQPGQIVISLGDEVKQRHIDMFQALGLMNPTIDYGQVVGMVLILLGMVLSLGIYCYRFAPEVYANFTHLVAVAAILLAVAFIYRFASQSSYFEALAVTAAATATMLLALTLGATMAAGAAMLLGMLVGLMSTASDVRMVIVTLLCAFVAAQAIVASSVRSRSLRIVQAAAITAAVNCLLLLAGAVVSGNIVQWPLLGAAAAGGLVAPTLAVGLALALERPLGILTDMGLLELGNPNEPVLRALLREAPASYQSSIMVANLAEQAAEAIGANALLVRTAAIYHDIGKTKRPYFFVENQPGDESPHDRLNPHLSALIVISHVKDGQEIAEHIALPPQIAAVIPEHHGTSLIPWFYERAKQEAAEGEEVDEQAFRYPGPKPQSKETAIIMLADSVEAAARTLEDPSPTKIESLVERLVQEKIDDGQLDECPLTMADIRAIKRSFIATLGHIYHHRIKYPDQIRQEAEEALEAYRRTGEIPKDWPLSGENVRDDRPQKPEVTKPAEGNNHVPRTGEPPVNGEAPGQ